MKTTSILIGATCLGACTMVPQEEDPMYLKVTAMDGRLSRVERMVENEGLMDMMGQIEQLEKDNQALRSEVETLQYQLEQASGRQRELYLDVDQRLQAVEATTAGVAALNVLDGGSLDQGELPVPGGTDRANYQAAFELLKQGRYDQAAMALQQFMVAFPESSLLDNAQYWLAETHYVTQDYKRALPEFEKVLSKFPDSRKIPDALLKIGYCNYELSEWGPARTALASVAADYPETTAARLANQRLERMEREGH